MPARRLSLVSMPDDVPVLDRALRVAFASSDLRVVDQHFGSAAAFVVHAVTPDTSRLLDVTTFAPAQEDGREGKLDERIAALASCNAVYVQAIGASAIGKLRFAGVRPMKAVAGTPIGLLIAGLQRELAGAQTAPRPTLTAKDPARFDTMDAAAWNE